MVERSAVEISCVRSAIDKVKPGRSAVTAVVQASVRHHLHSLELFRAEYVCLTRGVYLELEV